MKLLSTLLQNAVEDYFKQLPEITLTDLQEVCEFNLSDVAFIASRAVQDFKQESNKIPQEKVFDILTKTGNSLIGFPVGERIYALANIKQTALRYGYNMFYGINEEPYMCYRIQHTEKDNNKIVAVGFEKIKK